MHFCEVKNDHHSQIVQNQSGLHNDILFVFDIRWLLSISPISSFIFAFLRQLHHLEGITHIFKPNPTFLIRVLKIAIFVILHSALVELVELSCLLQSLKPSFSHLSLSHHLVHVLEPVLQWHLVKSFTGQMSYCTWAQGLVQRFHDFSRILLDNTV